jgi:molybdate transport system substrate-binding protein
MIRTAIALTAALFASAVAPPSARAAEIKLVAAAALEQVLTELVPQFEKDTGHRVTVVYGPIGALTDRLAKGEQADVAIVADRQVDDLQKSGKVLAGTRVDVATFRRKNREPVPLD